MSVIFMTEKEADDLIEANMEYLVSKIQCATQCSESAAGTSLSGECSVAECSNEGTPEQPSYLCCGCCENGAPGTQPWRNL